MNILNKNFNKKGRQFKIFLVVYKAQCSLHFHSLGIDNVCEGEPVLQAIFSMFKCVGKLPIMP
jgi:hypothetical protein